MHTAIIGASRGIGRAAALDLLRDPENTVSLLLRSPKNIEQDAVFADALRGGRVRVVKGDAYDPADLRELLADDSIDSVVSSLGTSQNHSSCPRPPPFRFWNVHVRLIKGSTRRS